MMDVEQNKEDIFNELYETKHIPQINTVPGVISAVRYKTEAEGHPKYLAIYEVEREDTHTSVVFRNAADKGRWTSEVRPYTCNRQFALYVKIS
jgi:hypothetical protein